MQRTVFFVYGLFCHLLFLIVYAWMAVFVGNLGFGLIRTIDGAPERPVLAAALINLGLIAAFGLQHSIMARPGFKRWWTQFVPQPIERSTYVLFSCIAMSALLWLWQPLGGMVWQVSHPAARWALHGLLAFGWRSGATETARCDTKPPDHLAQHIARVPCPGFSVGRGAGPQRVV
ncbi:MAG: hypothetical protein IT430_04850, partial [Phycisphaerales bacterium]|nr:hypothetical protein [Phycisphaerales bacterium]